MTILIVPTPFAEQVYFTTLNIELGKFFFPINIVKIFILSLLFIIRPFAYALLAVICLQLIFIVMDFMILCFHPRDSLQKILEKSGTIQRV
jgi:hypothetical protein